MESFIIILCCITLKNILWKTLFVSGKGNCKGNCCKDKYFNLAIGKGLCYIKWLKNGVGQSFIFHAVIPAHYSFDEKFIS